MVCHTVCLDLPRRSSISTSHCSVKVYQRMPMIFVLGKPLAQPNWFSKHVCIHTLRVCVSSFCVTWPWIIMSAVTVDVITYCECQHYLLQGCCTGNTNVQKIGENNGLWKRRRCLLFQHQKELSSQGGPVLPDRYKAFCQPCVLFNWMFQWRLSNILAWI